MRIPSLLRHARPLIAVSDRRAPPARARAAVQIIEKPSGSKIAMLKAEVDILTKCDHPNVVKMHAVYETETHLFLCLELLTGGELFDRIISKVRRPPEHAAPTAACSAAAAANARCRGIRPHRRQWPPPACPLRPCPLRSLSRPAGSRRCPALIGAWSLTLPMATAD